MITTADISATAKDFNKLLSEDELKETLKEFNQVYPMLKKYQTAYSIIVDLIKDKGKRF